MKDDLISVIVPVYNVENYLERCIKSIITQTYRNIEIILVDDGSTDKSSEICDNYCNNDERIRVFHKKNEGVSVARNYGLDNSNGRYITFVDSDDYLEQTFIEELYNCIINENIDYIACGYSRVYDSHSEKINASGDKKRISQKEYLKQLLNVQNGFGFVHMKLIKKDIIGDLRFNKDVLVGEDALFNVMLCKNLNEVMLYFKPLYNYYFNNNSVVRKYDDNYAKKYYKSMKYMTEYINNTYPDDVELRKGLYNYISYHVLLICVNYCYHPKNKEKGIKLLKEVCEVPLFANAIKNSNYANLSLTRIISLFMLKRKLYIIESIICRIRQRQFRREGR